MPVKTNCPKSKKMVGLLTCEDCIYYEGLDEEQQQVVCTYRFKMVAQGWEEEEEEPEH